MRKIIVHNPCNEHTRNFRNYNQFWDDLTNELKKKYIVKENRYYEKAHMERYQINLKKGISDYYALYECEYVIEFEDTGEFYLLSVSDRISAAMINEAKNPLLKKVLISQFNYDYIKHHIGDDVKKYNPWIYFPQNVLDYETYYNKRQLIENKIDKMYFRGGTSYRPILQYFDNNILEGTEIKPNYFDDLINYKVGLSIAGVGELCYRDIEYMCIGVPFIRFEYLSELNPNLIPNHHYISVNRPNDIPKHNDLSTDRLGLKHHAKMIEERFNQIKDDEEYLDFVSNNAREYYKKYLSETRVDNTLKLLGI